MLGYGAIKVDGWEEYFLEALERDGIEVEVNEYTNELEGECRVWLDAWGEAMLDFWEKVGSKL